MKLQLKGSIPNHWARQIGDRTDGDTNESLKTDLYRVLDHFAQERHDPLTRRDLVAVLESMGWPTPFLSDGDGWHVIADAINDRCTSVKHINGRKVRGYYTQGSRVTTPEATTVSPSPVSTDGVDVVAKAGLAWAPETVEVPEVSEENIEARLYTEDVGLRRMAVEQTPCFGSYFKAAPECGECPLARWCQNTSLASMRDVAAELDQLFAEQVKSAQKPAEPDLVGEFPHPVGEDDEEEVDQSPVDEDDISAVITKLQKTLGDAVSQVSLPFEGVCTQCDQKVAKGVKMVHITGVGMLHSSCALEHHSS